MSFKKRWKEPDKAKPIHIFIATPAYDGKVQTDFAMSLAETGQMATAFGIRMTVTIMRNNIFIDHARNHFVRLFLESDATHLFFIDSDLKFEPRAVIGLAKAGKEICAGVYPKRQTPEEYPARFAIDPETDGIWVQDGWVLCSRVPTGFLCIERSVIQKMWDAAKQYHNANEEPVKRLFYTYINDKDTLVGEDFAFCEDYAKQFEKLIPVYPDFDFTHGEHYVGNFHHYLNKLTEIERAEEAAEKSAA
jgi:hypothetical protein